MTHYDRRYPAGLTAILVLTAAFLLLVLPVPAAILTDDAGSEIALNETPRRIVSLSPSNTETLAALGLADQIVGITDVCDYPVEIQNKTRIGGYATVSIEKVAALHPDLVVASDKTPRDTVKRLRSIGFPVIVIAPKNVSHVITDIGILGNVTGSSGASENLTRILSSRIAQAPARPLTGSPTVAHVVYNKPLYISGNSTLQHDIITRAGGVNVFAGRAGWGTVSLEEFLVANPDIIIVSSGGGMDQGERDLIREDFLNNPQYASLSAVKNNRVYAIDSDVISRPGPRVADAYDEVHRVITQYTAEATRQDPVAQGTTPQKSPGFLSLLAVVALAIAGVKRGN